MSEILMLCAAILVGFFVLFKSADQFVVGSVATAKNLAISPMIIGLTIVALGTSAPEIFVAMTAALQGEPELAIGNAIGSNIANIGMVLGITTLVVPLRFKPDILKKDFPILIFVTLCCGITLIDYKINIWDGLLLLAGLAIFLYRIVAGQNTSEEACVELEELDEIPDMTSTRAIVTLLVSLVFLLTSSQLLVWSAINLAQNFGISELIIGLTVIAVGTSLPELVVSLTSSLRGQSDLAIGNIVGSNIFNILAVFSIPCLLGPTEIDPSILWRDYALMLLLTVALVVVSLGIRGERKVNRIHGSLLLAVWLGYVITLYNTTIYN
ncbi:MAG: calcium/sodium antiporter [Pseudomonadales bacterium]|nr:calcium/sodium antiporter [Pseudomonadales bacterium]